MSPMRNMDPFSGDVVYTEALLEHPPPGVTYVTYQEALQSGELREHGRRASIAGGGAMDRARGMVTVAREHAVNALRERNVLFREPFRFMEVLGDFDLVHCHTYSVRWTGRPTAIVVSNAIPLRELYREARNWDAHRVDRADRADRLLARALRVDHIEYGLGTVDRVVAFSQTLADWYVEHGVAPGRVGVAPCFPSGSLGLAPRRPVPGRIGFVAGAFSVKGGDAVLAAMPMVRRSCPDAHLVIAGGDAPLDPGTLDRAAATVAGYLARPALLSEFLPACEVFAYPSRFDGLPLTLLEAMATGLPCVVSDYFALPEIIGAGGRSVPRDDVDALAEGLVALLDPQTNRRVGAAAGDRYRTTYSPEAVGPRLRENYDLGLRSWSAAPTR